MVICLLVFSASELWEAGAVEVVLKSTVLGSDELSSMSFSGKVQRGHCTLLRVGRQALLTHSLWASISWVSFSVFLPPHISVHD